ncbi:rho GTPase-activating protein 24-like isoform X4 [Lytechinus variegatus]|uniref:rho GTPase-activating protein 24-like isoform X4 n=1 Tax=Lytechinus variegatus TaxID=7654 RepID=UPI001BB20FD6|nr:rho GTPase-activating protein 24-like isoform X4 [Lytechinus variegatus]
MHEFCIFRNDVHVSNRRMTDRIINIQDEDVIHRGWLKKQGGAFRSWQRRYFKVAGDFMYYYTKEEDTRALGYIPLRGNVLKKHPYTAEEPGKYLFEILPEKPNIMEGKASQGRLAGNHDSFLLWATNQAEMDEWTQVIRRVMYGRRGGGIFGQSLLDTLTSESTTTTKQIPSIIEQCVTFIKNHGLYEEGIFRLPGRTNKVKELQDLYDVGVKPDFEELKSDVHTVASLLKLYLRSLPEPVIPWQHYEHFYEAIKLYEEREDDGKGELIRELALLPRCNYNLMKYMCCFLHDVQKYEKYNRMGVLNLSTVFGPNMFRANNEDPTAMMEATSMSQKFIHLLIAEYDTMFPSNDRISFSNGSKSYDDLPNAPVPPPRHKAHSQMPSGSFDLIKELQDRQGRTPRVQTMASDSLLIDLNPEEEFDMEHYGNSAFSKRSYSVDDGLVYRDSISGSDTASISSLGTSEQDSHHVPYSEFQDTASVASTASIKTNSESLVMINPACQLQMPHCDSTNSHREPETASPRKERSGLGIDLMQGTPESDLSHIGDLTLSYSHLQEQVRALKQELSKQKEDYDQKLRKWKMKCEGMQIQYDNAESARRATDERNKQLLKQLNAFIDEYGPQ